MALLTESQLDKLIADRIEQELRRRGAEDVAAWTQSPTFPTPLEKEVGCRPKTNVKFQGTIQSIKRVGWVEVELKRADPGANPLKFYILYKNNPPKEHEYFFSALSHLLNPGRRNLTRYFTENILREVMPRAYAVDILPEFRRREEFNRLPDYTTLPPDHSLCKTVDASLDKFVNRVLGIVIGHTETDRTGGE